MNYTSDTVNETSLSSGLGEDLFRSQSINIKSTEIQQAIVATQEIMFNRGRHDGALGIIADKEQKDDLASVLTHQLYADAIVKLAGETAKANHIFSEKKNKRDQVDTELKNQQKHLEVLTHLKRQDPKSYSSTYYITYITIGCILLVADLPLAFKLIEQGFGFDRMIDIALTAIGVSCCTIFIKIIYDEFVAPPFGSPVIAEKYFFRLFGHPADNNAALTDNEVKRINNWKTGRTIAKLSLLVGTISVICILGFFRTTTIHSLEADKKVEAILAKTLAEGLNENISDSARRASIKQGTIEAQNATKNAQDEQDAINTKTFIGITLLFPIISGVCFSMGFNYRQNRKALKAAQEDLDKEQEKSTQAEKEYEEALFAARDLEMAKEQLHLDWESQFRKKLVAIYDYGYTIGHTRPELMDRIPDLITIVESWRDKKLYYTTNQLL